MKTNGFSFTELVIVILIIGVLAGIMLPKYNDSVEKSRQVEAVNVLTKLHAGYKRCIIDTGGKPSGGAAWADFGFDSDPNSNFMHFTYSCIVGATSTCTATNKVDTNQYITIDLDSGQITKTAPY